MFCPNTDAISYHIVVLRKYGLWEHPLSAFWMTSLSFLHKSKALAIWSNTSRSLLQSLRMMLLIRQSVWWKVYGVHFIVAIIRYICLIILFVKSSNPVPASLLPSELCFPESYLDEVEEVEEAEQRQRGESRRRVRVLRDAGPESRCGAVEMKSLGWVEAVQEMFRKHRLLLKSWVSSIVHLS